jgi:hypothetical protein
MGKNKFKGNRAPYIPASNGSTAVITAPANDELPALRAAKERLEGENAELRAKLQPYLDVIGKAEKDAEDWIQLIKQDESTIREESRRQLDTEMDRLRVTAHEEAEKLRSDAHTVASTIKQDAETRADEILQSAQSILNEAKAKADRTTEDAENDAKTKREELEAEIAHRTQEALEHLEKDQSEVRKHQELLLAREKSVQKDEQRLLIIREDVTFDLEGIQLRRAELEKRWNECSPDRLWMLERTLESERRKGEGLAAVVTDLQAQCDRLRRDQENMAGRSASALLAELESLRTRTQEMAERFASLPSDHELSALRKDAAELRIVREQRDELDREVQSHMEAAARQDLGVRELNQVKIEADALRILNDELQKQIQLNSKALTQRTGACFPELLRIDSVKRPQRGSADKFRAADGNLLSSLVQHVRTYAASLSEKPLYYSDMDIRTFLAGLATSPLMILQGLSGTGKTSLPRIFAEAILAEHRKISVQSNWRDRHELLGYYNDFNKRFTETEFTQALYTAALPDEEDVPWFIVLDEVNLARIEYYFADFLSVLEEQDRSRWAVELMSFDPTTEGATGPFYLQQNRMLKIPENVWFVGTANQDESTFEITDKVYDRAQLIDFQHRHAKIAAAARGSVPRRISLRELHSAFDNARLQKNNCLDGSDLEYLDRLDNFLVSEFDVTFGNRILDQIRSFVPVYVASGGTKSEGFDIQFSRKILRKLGSLHEPSARKSLDRLTEELGNSPRGWEPLLISIDTVERITKKCL